MKLNDEVSNDGIIPDEDRSLNTEVQKEVYSDSIVKPPFEEWYKTVPEYKNDTLNYDLRAAYENLPYEDMDKFATSDAHLPDTYKRATHPTFSNESIYSNDSIKGGEWVESDSGWVFKASKHNVMNMGGAKEYKKWFKENEPDAILVLPKTDNNINDLIQKQSIQNTQSIDKTSMPATKEEAKAQAFTAQQFQDLNNLSDIDFRNKYNTSKHKFRYDNIPAYKKYIDENAKKNAAEFGTIDLPESDIRSKNYTGNPNLAFMTPNDLKGKSAADYEKSNMELIQSVMPIPGIDKINKASKIANETKSIVKDMDYANIHPDYIGKWNGKGLSKKSLGRKDIKIEDPFNIDKDYLNKIRYDFHNGERILKPSEYLDLKIHGYGNPEDYRKLDYKGLDYGKIKEDKGTRNINDYQKEMEKIKEERREKQILNKKKNEILKYRDEYLDLVTSDKNIEKAKLVDKRLGTDYTGALNKIKNNRKLIPIPQYKEGLQYGHAGDYISNEFKNEYKYVSINGKVKKVLKNDFDDKRINIYNVPSKSTVWHEYRHMVDDIAGLQKNKKAVEELESFMNINKKGYSTFKNSTSKEHDLNPKEVYTIAGTNFRMKLVEKGILKDFNDVLTNEKLAKGYNLLNSNIKNAIKDKSKFIKWFNNTLPSAILPTILEKTLKHTKKNQNK